MSRRGKTGTGRTAPVRGRQQHGSRIRRLPMAQAVSTSLPGPTTDRAEIHDAYKRFGGFVMAELRIETEGSFAGAVRAFVNGVQLATVPHEHTLEFQTAVETLGRKGHPATLHVRLEADAYVDVWAFCEPAEWERDEPFFVP